MLPQGPLPPVRSVIVSLTTAVWLLTPSLAARSLGPEGPLNWEADDTSLEMNPGQLTHLPRIQPFELWIEALKNTPTLLQAHVTPASPHPPPLLYFLRTPVYTE